MLLVVFQKLKISTSTPAEIAISKLEHIFATSALPLFVKCDNGPRFSGALFYHFMTELEAIHAIGSPHWPQSNAEAERFMQRLGKAIKTTYLESTDWKRSICKYLLNYRAAPPAKTWKSLARLLLDYDYYSYILMVAIDGIRELMELEN